MGLCVESICGSSSEVLMWRIFVICGKYLWGLFEYFVFGEWVNKDLRCNNSSS